VCLIMFKTRHALPLRAEGFHVREAVTVDTANSHAIGITDDHRRGKSANMDWQKTDHRRN
jgi:hypothetical protein